MTSFARVLEQMNGDTVLEFADANPKAVIAIRAGLNIRPEFWDDFLKMCNQSQALSELLGVRREIIARWPNQVREGLAHVERQDSTEAASKKANLITTGY
jgi:hypothetical protein